MIIEIHIRCQGGIDCNKPATLIDGKDRSFLCKACAEEQGGYFEELDESECLIVQVGERRIANQ